MNLVRTLPTRALIIVLSCTLGLSAYAQDASSQIKAEIARLEKSVKDHPLSDPDLKSIAPMVADSLKSTSDALNSGHFYLALEKLGQAEDLLRGARVAADEKANVDNGGLPAFESLWGRVSMQVSALDREAYTRGWKHTPLAIRALAEAARGRSIPLLEGGRGFATANGPKEGLFYVGQAEGEDAFANFCESLKVHAKGSSLRLRSLLPELQQLQQKTNTAFQPPKSIDLHPRFIALNSQIKLAEELDSQRFYAGALYAYLDAVRHYGMLDAPTLDPAAQEQVKQDLAASKALLESSSSDDSIAQLFLERAESYTTHPDGSAPSSDEWRGARVILDQILPAYYAAQKPPSQLAKASGKTVDVTLVRWPYT